MQTKRRSAAARCCLRSDVWLESVADLGRSIVTLIRLQRLGLRAFHRQIDNILERKNTSKETTTVSPSLSLGWLTEYEFSNAV